MAFVKVEKGLTGSFRRDSIELRMGSHLQSKTGTSRGVYLSLSRSLIDAVGWKKTSPEDNVHRVMCMVEVQEGVGSDAGFLLLTEAKEGAGYALGTTSKKARSFSMALTLSKLKHYILNDVPTPTEPVEFSIEDRSILIQCPDWLRYNPESYDEPPKPEVKKPISPTKAAVERKELVKAVAKEDPSLNHKQRRALVSVVTRALK